VNGDTGSISKLLARRFCKAALHTSLSFLPLAFVPVIMGDIGDTGDRASEVCGGSESACRLLFRAK
jgi:hypothetical protein